MTAQTNPPPEEAAALKASRTPPFKIKDVNCNFLIQFGTEAAPSLAGDPRTYKPTTGLSMAERGSFYGSEVEFPNPVPGIIVGYYSTAVPRITNPADYAEYESANRMSFEMFNFVYKVWTPCVKAELDVSDFEEKNKKQFEKKVATMADVTVSMGANDVQGAIPPGTLVWVKFADINTLRNPEIVRVQNKLFNISSMVPDPPGRKFVLGTFGGGAPGTLGSQPSSQGGNINDLPYTGDAKVAKTRPDTKKWNPEKIGQASYTHSPVRKYWRTKEKQNACLNQADLTVIEGSGKNSQSKPYSIHPDAHKQYMAMFAQAKQDGVPRDPLALPGQIWRVTSAYRDRANQGKVKNNDGAAAVGTSPHGWGGAFDIGTLYRAAKRDAGAGRGGSAKPLDNAIGCCADSALDGDWKDMPTLASKIYRWLIMNGPKYGWYNPSRLADGRGTMDEIWHFEYWGPVPAPGTVLPSEKV